MQPPQAETNIKHSCFAAAEQETVEHSDSCREPAGVEVRRSG